MQMEVGGTLRSSILRGTRLMSMLRNDRDGISVQRLTKSERSRALRHREGPSSKLGGHRILLYKDNPENTDKGQRRV